MGSGNRTSDYFFSSRVKCPIYLLPYLFVVLFTDLTPQVIIFAHDFLPFPEFEFDLSAIHVAYSTSIRYGKSHIVSVQIRSQTFVVSAASFPVLPGPSFISQVRCSDHSTDGHLAENNTKGRVLSAQPNENFRTL